MNQQIKQRIDQLNNGEIPNGYKKTEFGVFPCDWETKQLAQLLDFKNGVNADKEKYNSGTKMISVNDILTDRPIVYESIQGQVDVGEDALKEYSVTYGDILFQRSSETFEDAGKSNVYLDPNRIATYSGFVIRGKKKAEYEPYYLNEALRMGKVRKQIIRHAAGSQHINVGQDSLASVTIPFATPQEQSKTAEILMKWDEAIELYQQQIEKLNKLKRSALANLFPQKGKSTPKYRFAGFTDPWEQRKLGEIAVIAKGEQINKVKLADSGRYYVLNGGMTPSGYTDSYNTRAGTISISEGGNSCGYVAFNTSNFWSGGHNYTLIQPKISSKYLYQCLKRQESGIMALRVGSGLPNIQKGRLSDITITFPHSDEQELIADCLCGIDNLITLHQRKVDTVVKQRAGLQQYLLNGIVRV